MLGENGAGKSTLMKIVSGVTQPDAGRSNGRARPIVIHSPAQARRLGHRDGVPAFLAVRDADRGREHRAGDWMTECLRRRRLARVSHEVSTRYGLPIDPQRLVHSMSVGERQRVEIVRCLLQQPKLLILDEPTSVSDAAGGAGLISRRCDSWRRRA